MDEGKHLSIKDFEKSLNLLQMQTWRAVRIQQDLILWMILVPYTDQDQ